MALEDESPQLERVGNARGGHLPPALIVIVAAFVVVALVKPWGSGPVSPSSAPGRRPVVTPPMATPPAAAGAAMLYFQQCFDYAGWRLTAIQQSGRQKVRTVWPVAARFDPTMPEAGAPRLFGDDVSGIGFCAPSVEPSAIHERVASVSLWRRDVDGAVVRVDGTRVIDPRLAGEGEVYLAPPAALANGGDWPVGDYFFAITSGAPGGSTSWLPLQLLPAQVRPTPAPTMGPPAASPSPGSASQAVRRP